MKNLNLKSPKNGRKKNLSEEFKSLGFYISDHPLNDYETIFEQLQIMPFKKYQREQK